MKKKVGFFGGSFDPIHLGHLNLAIQIQEYAQLDEIIFSPAALSPFKQEHPPIASDKERLQMIELALDGISKMSFSDQQIKKKPPSYTIDAMRHLIETNGGHTQVFLILGEDSVEGFLKWKDAEKLIELAPPLIGTRFGLPSKGFEGGPKWMETAFKKGMCPIPAMDISSRNIRFRLQNHLYCGHLLSQKVLDYIYQNQLYLAP